MSKLTFFLFFGIIKRKLRGDIMTNFTEIDKEIEEIIESKKYPIVNLKIFDSVKNITVSESTKDHLQYTLELYKNYLTLLKKLSTEHFNRFLTTLKAAEIIDNQKLEKENSFLLSLYMTTLGDNSIDEIIKIKEDLTKEDLLRIQKLLLEGTSAFLHNNDGYRTNNRKFVGTWKNGNRNIQYFPIHYKEIEEATQKFLEYYNYKDLGQDYLLKPFIIHGLLASLQLFNDGNTRMSRLLQHKSIWEITNSKLGIELPSPAIYISRSYYPYRDEYRNKIKEIAVNSSDDTWNKWFDFNLNRLEDQLFYISENLEQYKKIIK